MSDADRRIPSPSTGEGQGGGVPYVLSPHPNLPPHRGEAVLTSPSQPARGRRNMGNTEVTEGGDEHGNEPRWIGSRQPLAVCRRDPAGVPQEPWVVRRRAGRLTD